MSKKSDLLVLQEMSEKNLDIRCTTTVTNIKAVKQGAIITFGIDGATGQQLMVDAAVGSNEFICVCYVVNRKQFLEIKND